MEKSASKGAERQDELAGITALESSAGKLQKKLLEILLRLRRVLQPRVSCESFQCTPFFVLNG